MKTPKLRYMSAKVRRTRLPFYLSGWERSDAPRVVLTWTLPDCSSRGAGSSSSVIVMDRVEWVRISWPGHCARPVHPSRFSSLLLAKMYVSGTLKEESHGRF
jgi:hypothetical protein